MAHLTVDEVVARAPTLTPEQAQILRGLLAPVHSADEQAPPQPASRRAS